MSHVGVAVLGVLASLAALAVHRSGVLWLVLAVVTSVAVARLLRYTTRRRLAASYSLGWLLVFGVAVTGRPEGDYVLAGDLAGYTLTATALVLLVLGVTALSGGRGGRT